MNKIRYFSCLILIIIGLSLPYKVYTDETSEDEPVEVTPDPILTSENAAINCTSHNSCEDCVKASCYWLVCVDREQYCDDDPEETCSFVQCSNITTTTPPTTTPPTTTTVSPNTTTSTTTEPTTTITTEPPTTTENTTTTTTSTTTTPSTTTNATTTTTPSTTTNATTTTSPNSTTTSTSTTPAAPTTTTEAPQHRHFDAGSFVGGMILALTLTAVSYAGWKFYRRRALSTSYTNF